jgi:hypothetical protein
MRPVILKTLNQCDCKNFAAVGSVDSSNQLKAQERLRLVFKEAHCLENKIKVSS